MRDQTFQATADEFAAQGVPDDFDRSIEYVAIREGIPLTAIVKGYGMYDVIEQVFVFRIVWDEQHRQKAEKMAEATASEE